MPLRGESIIPQSVYISLNARAEPGTYHWGLIIMDSETEGTFHHATNPSGGWKYEMKRARLEHSITLVAVIRIGGLNDTIKAATDVIQSVPADGNDFVRVAKHHGAKHLGEAERGRGAYVENYPGVDDDKDDY
ncbi:hypothetical protein C8A00DRAFT_29436 [Chaetomidium leptoderma]|uniref:Uncharacterized protein n=1 Tax=Chaetomidium leptoderma TaxID=669021 RepID=A0AAN6VTQ4_9PEZI|nr:hypothetical protein C8A00DRAFT_29436 [Chaetomidium leptoderma]